jgi:hypothetical protein
MGSSAARSLENDIAVSIALKPRPPGRVALR